MGSVDDTPVETHGEENEEANPGFLGKRAVSDRAGTRSRSESTADQHEAKCAQSISA